MSKCPWQTEIKNVLTGYKCQHFPGMVIPNRECANCSLLSLAKIGSKTAFALKLEEIKNRISPPAQGKVTQPTPPPVQPPTTQKPWESIPCGGFKFGDIVSDPALSPNNMLGIAIGEFCNMVIVLTKEFSWTQTYVSTNFILATHEEQDKLFTECRENYYANCSMFPPIHKGDFVMLAKSTNNLAKKGITEGTIFEVESSIAGHIKTVDGPIFCTYWFDRNNLLVPGFPLIRLPV